MITNRVFDRLVKNIYNQNKIYMLQLSRYIGLILEDSNLMHIWQHCCDEAADKFPYYCDQDKYLDFRLNLFIDCVKNKHTI